jgi:hypothetical protein
MLRTQLVVVCPMPGLLSQLYTFILRGEKTYGVPAC